MSLQSWEVEPYLNVATAFCKRMNVGPYEPIDIGDGRILQRREVEASKLAILALRIEALRNFGLMP